MSNIDPDAFTFPELRILIGPGERALVWDALMWGLHERDPEPGPDSDHDAEHDPIMQLWTAKRGDDVGKTRTEFGYTMIELLDTRIAIEASRNPDDPHHRARDLEAGLAVVKYAIKKMDREYSRPRVYLP